MKLAQQLESYIGWLYKAVGWKLTYGRLPTLFKFGVRSVRAFFKK
ncbi:MAG: hypothetical protein RR912_09400 [Clostridium sp.]